MTGASLQREVEAICRGLTDAPSFADLELLRCTVRRERDAFVISLVIDREGGVDANLCEAVSRYVERRIEALPPPIPLFTLEVASAGVERPLVRPEHYRRFRNRIVRVITTLRIRNRTEFLGAIEESDDNAVVIRDRYAGPTPIPYAAIKRATLYYDPRWDLERKQRP
jgi:ribosome maturation factor RimP